MKHYEYSIQMNIKKDIHQVFNALTDEHMMVKWDKNLTKIVDEKQDEGRHIRKLHYRIHDHEMIMKETLELINPPHHFFQVYEVDQVWNACDNRLVSLNNYTQWTMDVVFKIESDDLPNQEAFESKTKETMQVIKSFIENL